MDKKNEKIEGERTRIEFVYKPKLDEEGKKKAKRIRLGDLTLYPPQINSRYFGAVVTNLDALKKKQRALVMDVQKKPVLLNEISGHYRRQIKEWLAGQSGFIDFDQLAQEHWIVNARQNVDHFAQHKVTHLTD